ncbi:tetratricopeptide repeat protein [Hyalangium gracile]|uniref:tetratricopeptide repeat protein n=1 Tax=Hyalangium gracile TaxID=394092 RepID=UPI001CCD9A7C|nr:tetratricopeptide repeat protein [Hyalangium gracile]
MSQQGSGQAPREMVDALIVAATPGEYDAVLEVGTGAERGSDWVKRPGPAGFEVALRTFQAVGGGTLRVAVTRSREMGGVAAVTAAAPIVQAYSPRCLAMCGGCAGRPGEVELGDVIIADRLWTYDTGRLELARDGSGAESSRVLSDVSQYQLNARWKDAARSFAPDASSPWLGLRPRAYEAQRDWVLERLQEGEDPRRHPDRAKRCPDYEEVIDQLWKARLVEDGKLRLTDEGRERIERLLNRYPDGLPEPRPFKVHVGPIATGSRVVRDPRVFDELAMTVRKVKGLEMEASAIAALAHELALPYMIVMKGVTDFGDPRKGDHFQDFAARASAECLLAFLRQHLPPAASLRKDEGASDRLLVPGTVLPPRERSAATLLNARYQLVEFFRPIRAELLRELQAWCDAEESVSVQLFHGAGGIGKTHLFIQWCKELGEQGWRAGFLEGSVDADHFEPLAVSSTERPTFVVVDYAESHQGLGALLQIAARLRSAGGRERLRIVLIAREPGAWWEELQKRSAELRALLRDRPPVEVAPVAPEGAEREAVFWHAARRFAELLGSKSPTQLPSSLEDPRFGRVLYIHMAALAAVREIPFTAESLMEGILDHEEHFWATWLETRKPVGVMDADRRLFQERVRHAVTALTLTGGASSRQEALALLERSCGARDELLLLLLQDLYPKGGAAAQAWKVGGLEPDLLGEALVLRTLRGEGRAASGWLRSVFDGADEGTLRAGFEVLGRLSIGAAEAGGWISSLLEGAVETRAVAALEAAKAVGQRMAYAALGGELEKALEREGTPEVARRLMEAGLPERSISLRGVAVRVLTLLLKHLPPDESTESLAERAQLLNNLGLFQTQLGQREGSLDSTQQAVRHYRALAHAHPEAYLSELALGLNNLGQSLSEMGRREEALAALLEAVGHYRTLAEQGSEESLPNLAMSLNNLSLFQGEMGRREEALGSALEAVALYRALARKDPEQFLPNLALCLSNLARCQSERGMRDEAVGSSRESLGHYRGLARKHPEAFLPELAMSLTNLGLFESELGRREEALRLSQEAVGHYRELARKHPEAFLSDLATSLTSLGGFQSELGKREEALRSSEESVGHFRTLVQRHPEAFLPDLALSLINLGLFQSELGKREEALRSEQEAVSHYRTLAGKQPEAFMPRLAHSLNSLGLCQGELGMREEALGSAWEAVIHYRALVEKHPEAFLPDLAMSLLNLGKSQGQLGRREEALDSTREAVGHYRELARKHPEAFQPTFAHSLNNLGLFQSELGRREEALRSAQEAVGHYHELIRKQPEAFLHDLSMCLANLATFHSELGSKEEALAFAREAVRHYRALEQKHPGVFLPELAMGVNNLGVFQSDLGRNEEALVSAQEALDHYRTLARRHPEMFLPDVAMALSNVCNFLGLLGRGEEALGGAHETVGLYRELARKHPKAFLPELAKSLNNLGELLSRLGRRQEALSAARESLDVLWPFFLEQPQAFERQIRMVLGGLLSRHREAGIPPPEVVRERQKIYRARRSSRART